MSSNKDKKETRFRDLDEGEQEALFAIYKKHTGNLSAMARDDTCAFDDRNQISYYKDLYNFHDRFQRISAEEAEADRREMREKAVKAKVQAIHKAAEFLNSEDCTSSDMKRSYEIVKTELGEPTSINKNDNMNKFEDEVGEVEVTIKRNEPDNSQETEEET